MRRILLTLPRLLLLVVATATTVSAHHDHHEASVIGGIKGSSGLDGSLRHHSHVSLGSSLHGGQSNRAAGLKWSSEGVAGHSSDLGGMIDSVLRYHQDVKDRMNLDFSGFGKSSVSGQGSGQLIGNGGGAGAGGIGSLLGSAVGSLAGKLNVGGGGGAADQRATIDDEVVGGIGSLLGRASGSAGLVGNINVNGRVGGAAETAGSVESGGSIVIVDDGATKQESNDENQELGWVIPTQNVEYEIIVRKNDDENDDDRQEIFVILDGSKGEEGVSSSIRAETGPEIERLIILEEPSSSSSSSNQRLAEQILTIKSSTKDEEEVREEQVPMESSSSSSSSAAVVVSVLPSSILSEVSRVASSGSSAISKPLSYNAAGGTSAATAAAGGADAKVNLGLNFNNLNNNNNNQARNSEDLHASIAEYTNNLKNSIRTKFGGALDGGLNVKTSGGGGGSGLFNLVNII
ncbi:putative mediator of RNA polymerase II transcription subunit 17 [Trichogramma pretiosum]|uniref:putative mediator of RNA polymerase II transcription subunit 17 n=1 Tax=Trichogramma pretiosum TaxID=7493 RepID=UPI0006C9D503|nr:putative mediator of RNA polymerase II transcription subunit 17 [Trichogramma pretiosum]